MMGWGGRDWPGGARRARAGEREGQRDRWLRGPADSARRSSL
jgi:hypothetical protein